MTANYTPPLTELLFTMEHVACWREGMGAVAGGLPEGDIASIFEQCGTLVSEVMTPLNQPSDRAPSAWRDGVVTMPAGWKAAYRAWAEAGWNGISLPSDYGGAGMPVLMQSATMEMLTSACMAMEIGRAHV